MSKLGKRLIKAAKEAIEIVRLPPDEYAKFVRAIENPPKANAKLKRLMKQKAPWECCASNYVDSKRKG